MYAEYKKISSTLIKKDSSKAVQYLWKEVG